MRGLVVAVLVLALAPLAAAHAGHHGPEHLRLYGALVDAKTKRFELSPFPSEAPAGKVLACSRDEMLRVAEFAACNSAVFPLARKTLIDLDGGSEPVAVQFYLSYDAAAWLREAGVAQAPTVGGVRLVTVEASLAVDGRVVAMDTAERDLAPGDGQAQRFDFALNPSPSRIPAGASIELRMRWWQAEHDGRLAGTSFFVIHHGGSQTTQVDIPEHVDPLTVTWAHEAVDMARICAAPSANATRTVNVTLLRTACAKVAGPAVAVQATLVPTFENMSSVPANLSIGFEGPRAPRKIVGPFRGPDTTVQRFLYLWDYPADNADPRKYSLWTRVESAAVTDGLQEHEGRLASLSLPPPAKESPGIGFEVAMVTLLALVAARVVRRSP